MGKQKNVFSQMLGINFRSTPKVEARDIDWGNFSITSFFGNGKEMTEDNALKIPSVSSSVDLITSAMAQLPIYLYKEESNGEVIKIPDDRVFLLNEEPNELLNGYNFKKQIAKEFLLYGSSYIKIDRTRNKVKGLYPLPIDKIEVTKFVTDGYKYSAKINLNNGSKKVSEFMTNELVIVLKDSTDGATGKGILDYSSDTLTLALNEQTYSSNILKNGALPTGILQSAARLAAPTLQRLRESWQDLYGGANKAGKTIILEEGLEYKPISLKPNELDLTNSKKSTISEIARLFNVPESMINAYANKYASNEMNNIHFLQYCLSPIIIAIESALNKSLLLESEKKQGYYFRFDTSEILRTTEAEKIRTNVEAMTKGLISINEARSKIDMKALDTDYYLWNLGSVFYDPETNKMIIPNLGRVVDPENPEASIPDNQVPTPTAPKDSSDKKEKKPEKEVEE